MTDTTTAAPQTTVTATVTAPVTGTRTGTPVVPGVAIGPVIRPAAGVDLSGVGAITPLGQEVEAGRFIGAAEFRAKYGR